MSIGPLRRLAGCLGLLALAPTAVLLAFGRITPTDAAVRAVVTLVVVMVLARIARGWVAFLIRQMEREARAAEEAKPRRRREDAPTEPKPAGAAG